jgi:hypothetical protein
MMSDLTETGPMSPKTPGQTSTDGRSTLEISKIQALTP